MKFYLLTCLIIHGGQAFVTPSHTRLASRLSSTGALEDSLEEAKPLRQAVATKAPLPRSKSTPNKKKKTWQADLDRLLDPTVSAAQRQIILSDLFSANADIRKSVETALRDRKRRLQENTRAVARQIRYDILPSVSAMPVVPPKVEDFSKISNRLLNAVSNQLQRNLEILQNDLLHPNRIPQRISQQTSSILSEVRNIVSETPVNLKEPKYTVVTQTDDYEIRDYESYSVATTKCDDHSLAGQGAAFNRLAAYIFGANAESRVLEMTTPVTNTGTGEMRFFVERNPPTPLSQDASRYNVQSTQIQLEEIPAARLAVRRFTGFVTDNEIARQKQTLLSALNLDGIDLDVPHGQTVGHVVFQYNPPYTLPVVRRNEIAVPVVKVDEPPEVEWDYEV